MSYMRQSRWILSSRWESRRGLKTGLMAEGARWQFAYLNSAHRITANTWIDQGLVQVYEDEACHAHKRAMCRSRRWCVGSLTWERRRQRRWRLATRSKPKVTETISWMRCDEKLDRLVSGSTKCGSHATPQAIIWRNGVEQLSRERVKRRGLSV